MIEHWADVKKLFESMAYALKYTKPGDITVRFTNCTMNAKSTRTTKLMKIVNKACPKGDQLNPHQQQIDIFSILASTLKEYQSDIELLHNRGYGRLPSDRRKLLYILTSGQSVDDSINILEEQILSTMRALRMFSNMYSRIVLQMIHFGNDTLSYNAVENLCDKVDSQ